MSKITLLDMNLNLSKSILEYKDDPTFIATLKKVAIFTVIPFMAIVFFEVVVKKFVFTICNASFTIYNYFQPDETPC